MPHVYTFCKYLVRGFSLLCLFSGCSEKLNYHHTQQSPPVSEQLAERRGSHFPAQQKMQPPSQQQGKIRQDLHKPKLQQREKIKAPEKIRDEHDRDGLSIAALVLSLTGFILILTGIFVFFMPLGLLGFIMSLLAVIFGAMSVKRGKKGMSVAAITIGAIGLLLFLVVFIIYIIALSASATTTAVSSGNVCGGTGCNCAPDCNCSCGSPNCNCSC